MEFYSSGKLMLTSEYLVLAGATSLALPTQKGQRMKVERLPEKRIRWKSIDQTGMCWFEAEFQLPSLQILNTTDSTSSNRLQNLLRFCFEQSADLALTKGGYNISTHLEFDRTWGLGSSSSFISNLAKWAQVDGIRLMQSAFQGSGYDVAVGLENNAVVYSIQHSKPQWNTVQWKPMFRDQLFFVYLGQKQNSEQEVARFQPNNVSKVDIDWFTQTTQGIIDSKTLGEFEKLMDRHEARLSSILNRPTVKKKLFPNYPHAIKSLGAWGGDFILVVGDIEDHNYFKTKGYHTILTWQEMIATP